MSELDEAWELALAEAQSRARAAGRRDIADYLNLRRRNDLLRRTGTEWLINEFVLLAGEANRSGAGIQLERQDEHRFSRGNASMVGRQVTVAAGRAGRDDRERMATHTERWHRGGRWPGLREYQTLWPSETQRRTVARVA
jgi:hypothetical protein